MGDAFDDEEAGSSAMSTFSFEFDDGSDGRTVPEYKKAKGWAQIHGAEDDTMVRYSVTDAGTLKQQVWFALEAEVMSPLAGLLKRKAVARDLTKLTKGCGLWPKQRKDRQLYVVDSDGFTALMHNQRLKAKDEAMGMAVRRWLQWSHAARDHLLSRPAPSGSPAPAQTSSDAQYQMGGESNASSGSAFQLSLTHSPAVRDCRREERRSQVAVEARADRGERREGAR